jgi:hypothetical protein
LGLPNGNKNVFWESFLDDFTYNGVINRDELNSFFETVAKTPETAKGVAWLKPDGSRWYPKKDGFFEPVPNRRTLSEGFTFDRYGNPEDGYYASPVGTPYEARSLFPGSGPKHTYRVKEGITIDDVLEGHALPWFQQPGGGIQFKFNLSIAEMISRELIEVLN